MALKKTPAAKTPAASKPAPTATTPLVSVQPQSKQAAAIGAGLFLHTDDAWATAYFNPGDLHGLERVLFG